MRGVLPIWLTAGVVASRVLAAVVGGYTCSAGLVALAATALPVAVGMARDEAVVLAAMGGFVIYLTVLIWAFTEPRLTRVWVALLGGSAAGWGAAWWLA